RQLPLCEQHRGAHEHHEHGRDDLYGDDVRTEEGRGEWGAEDFRVLDLLSDDLIQWPDLLRAIRPTSDVLHGDENAEQGEEDRHLQQHRHTGRERGGTRFTVDRHHFLLHRLPAGRVGSSLVLLLQFLDLRLHDLHAPRCLDLAHEQGDEENPDDHRQGDDRKYPPPTALGVHPEKGEYFMRSHHDLGDNPLQGEQDLVKGSHATFSRLVASRRESLRRGDGLWTSLRR